MKFNMQTLTLALVALHGLGALLKTLVHSPKQAAKIDAIEAKVDAVGSQLATIAPQ